MMSTRPVWKESGLFWESLDDAIPQEKDDFDPKKEIIKITKFIYHRRLTYATGGNILLRYDNKYYSTPTGLGRYYLFELEEKDIIVCDKNRVCSTGPHKISIAANMHMNILEAFPEYDASLHTHGEFSAVFASLNKPIPNIAVTMALSLYGGGVPIIEFNKNYDILANNLIKKMKEIKKFRKEESSENIREYIGYKSIDSIPVAVLIEAEGLFIAAPDLRIAVTTAEAVEEAARCIIYASGLSNSPFYDKLI